MEPLPASPPLRLRCIACEIFYRELCAVAATSPHIVDLKFLPQGLHDLASERMAERLQKEIEATDASHYDGILLGFALCNNGIVGLSHESLPIIVPRSHDCIALLLGSRQTYDTIFHAHPGTYYKTSGWIERDHQNLDDEECGKDYVSPFSALNVFENFVEKYGEENAQYLVETLGLHNYSRMTYIDTPGLAPLPYADETRAEAEKTGLDFNCLKGDLGWLRRLLHGPWDDADFLTLKPGQRIAASHDENIIKGITLAE